jgi:hypothetical protein
MDVFKTDGGKNRSAAEGGEFARNFMLKVAIFCRKI